MQGRFAKIESDPLTLSLQTKAPAGLCRTGVIVSYEEPAGKNTPRPGQHTRLFASQLEALRAEATCKTCNGTGKGKGYQPKGGERTGLTKDGRPSVCSDCRGKGALGPGTKAEWLTLERVMSHRNNRHGLVMASADTMAKAAGLNRGTVQRALRRLVSRGLIEPTDKGPAGGTIRYFVPIPTASKPAGNTEEARDEGRAPARQAARTRATKGAHITSPKELSIKNYPAGTSTSSQQPSACDLCGVDGFVTVIDAEGYRTSQVCSHLKPTKPESAPVTLSESTVSETDRERLLTEMLQESKTVQRIEKRL